MPTLIVYRNGATAHQAVSHPVKGGPRGETKGWTPAVANRQRKWLWGVDPDSLAGYGISVTLTVKDCPPSSDVWAKMRRSWIERIGRKWNVIGIHWVTEWQARGVPHMHAAVYLGQPATTEDQVPATLPEIDSPMTPALLAVEWLLVCDAFGMEAGLAGQDAKPIDGAIGWLKYLSKHASRGANHYQRTGHPEGWNKTGRMWGHTGEWPTVEPMILPDLAPHEFYRIRRINRRWAEAEAKKSKDWARLAYLRRSAARHDKKTSRVIASSEWIPESETLRLIDYFERE